MPLDTATTALPARAAQARDDRLVGRPQAQESHPALAGWRAALAGAVVAAIVVLLAAPPLAAALPATLSWAAGFVERTAGLAPVMLGARAVVLVVALVLISKSDGRRYSR